MNFNLISRILLAGAILLTFLNCSSEQKVNPMNKPELLSFHHSLLTLDSHVDTPLRIKYQGIDLGKRYDPRTIKSKVDFPRMDEGGLDAAFFAVWTAQGPRDSVGHATVKEKALSILDSIESNISAYPTQAELAFNSEDASRLEKDGKHGIYLGLENGYPIGTDLENVNLFYDRGIRYVTLCHTSNNEICDSSNDTTEFDGLSVFGFQVVERMNQLGMMVDVSHLSDASVEDVLATTKSPVIASHSCAKAICDNPRNLNDELLMAIAAQGGVIQMCLYTDYVKTPNPNPDRDSAKTALKGKWGDTDALSPDQLAAYRIERKSIDSKYPWVLATVADAVDHIDHIVKIAGIDHVGIGTDFDGGAALADCYDVSELPNITAELIRRGYSKTDIAKIWSGNFLRVFKAVEAKRAL